jgi:hypothetical protein
MSKYADVFIQMQAKAVLQAGRRDPRYRALVKQVSVQTGHSIGTTIRKIQELADHGTTN